MKIVAATPELVPFLLARIPAERLVTMAAVMGDAPLKVISDCIGRSTVTWCAMDDVGPAWLGGVEPMLDRPGCGYVWQTVTPALAEHTQDYLLASQAVLPQALAAYPSLYAWIEASNDAALRHIMRLGGTVGPIETKNGVKMRLCERKA